jgi:hypothetical protein
MVTRQEQIIGNLEMIAAELRVHEERMTELYAHRLALWQEGQGLDPKMSQAVLAAPSGVTEGAVTQALRKVRLRKHPARV